MEWADFRLSLTTPAGLVPFVAGDPVAGAPAGTAIATMKGPMQFAAIGAGKYQRVSDERDGAEVSVLTYAASKPDEAHRLAGIVHGVRGCLEQLTGVPYPFRHLQLVEMDDWGWGQAPPGVIFITREALLSQAGSAFVEEDQRQMAASMSRSVNERIAHEVAHGWFPHVAKISYPDENWLSESVAEYMSSVCIERSAADRGRGQLMFKRQLSRWKSNAGLIGDNGSIYLAAHLGGREADGRDWQRLLYAKGPLVLHAIRQDLAHAAGGEQEGDRLFFTWIRSYVKNFLYKRGGTRMFTAVLNQVTSRDWQPWFEKYVYGTETPPIK
jgi:aminopeptidase N